MPRFTTFTTMIVLTASVAITSGAPVVLAQKSGAARTEPVTIQFAIYTDPARDKVAAEQAQLFMKLHPDIHVKVVSVPYSSYYQQLGTGIATGSAWDVFMINGAYFSQAAPKGALLDLTPVIQQSHLNMKNYVVDPTVSTYNGKTYALPYELDMSGIFYNRKLFDAAHLAYPKAGWTWADLLKDAKALTKSKNGQTTQWGFYSQYSLPNLTSFVAENGGSVLNADRTKSTFNTPQVRGAIQFMVDLVRKYHVSPGPNDIPPNIDPFATGKIAMYPGMSFEVLPDLKEPFDWGIAPWPVGKRSGADYWTQGVSVFRGTKNQQAATMFAQFLISNQAQMIQAKERGATPSLLSAAKSPAYVKSPPAGMDVFVKEYTSGAGAVEPFSDKWFKIMGGPTSAIQTELNKVWLGEESVAQGVKNADQAVTQVIAGP